MNDSDREFHFPSSQISDEATRRGILGLIARMPLKVAEALINASGAALNGIASTMKRALEGSEKSSDE